MCGPDGFELTETCQNCALRREHFFCQFESVATTKDFDLIQGTSAYRRGALLFLEGQKSRGIFVVCRGEVKLSISSSDGKALILKIAKAGDVLGLAPVMSGKPYDVQAETLSPCQIVFVPRDKFLRLMAKNPEVCLSVARELSRQCHDVCERMRDLKLVVSTSGKIAKLLLDWSRDGVQPRKSAPIKMPLTHENIGELVGSSRETVTRTLGELRDRKIVCLQDSILTVRSWKALEEIVSGGKP